MSVMPGSHLDELDRRIIAALQIDGRASWTGIAEALDEQERTVARRGTALLESGAVRVTGLSVQGEALLVAIRCSRGTGRLAASALAARPDTTFTYLLTGDVDVLAEVIHPKGKWSALVLDELPAISGVESCTSYPVLRYYRTVHEWRPPILTEQEREVLSTRPTLTPPATTSEVDLSPTDLAIVRALREDGRRTHDDLARIAEVSTTTVRRRVEAMRTDGRVHIHAVVEPALLGLAVGAVLRISTPPAHVEEAAQALLESPFVRYAAALASKHQIIAEVALPDRDALQRFVTEPDWVADVSSVEVSLLVDAHKRSGVMSNVSASLDGGHDQRS